VRVRSEEDIQVVELVLAMFDRFHEHAHAIVTDAGISTAQAAALLRLDSPLSQRELAECLKYDASNITSIVDSLEERGLVERQVDPTDRRVRRLVVTAEGSNVVAALRERLLQETPLLDRLDERERAQLSGLLAKAIGDHTPSGWVEMLRGRR
jgi:MarR family transcriptional regulator, organic hydroperoxide resistance regulator